MIYIPKLPDNCEKWGVNTETKKVVAQRNDDIIRSFKAGATIPQLAETFYLSEETIKKIVYRNKI